VKTGSDWTFPGFEVVEHPGARVLARPSVVAWVRFVLESGQGLHAAAARDRAATRIEGRLPVFVIPAKVRDENTSGPPVRWAIRHYARGGRIVSALLDDRYLRFFTVRPYHETRASETARNLGISTPRVLAAAYYPKGLFYRADLMTEFVPDSSDLVQTLFDSRRKGPGGAAERIDALRAAGGLLSKMAAAGIRHRDMNARNVLLEWKGAFPTAHLLDLDRCEVGPAGTSTSVHTMYQRLRRSIRKWESRTGVRITEKEWKSLSEAVTG
jgi:3-deoxy-D-manno-octulosonic acid kinase